MSEQDAIRWFKTQFGADITVACRGTPYTLDMAAAIAMQETYSDCWGRIYKTKPVSEVLKLCVGDTLDAPNRSAFPTSKAELVSAPGGASMFDVARQALIDVAQVNPPYQKVAQNPDKFCHGYGIFQYDIQFFKTDPSFFLSRGWHKMDECIKRLIQELDAACKRAYGTLKSSLTDDEMMYVAIAYNHGSVRVGGGPQQGFHPKDGGPFYGENFQRYLALAHATPVDIQIPGDLGPIAGTGTIPTIPAGQQDLPALVQSALEILQVIAARQQPVTGQAPAPTRQIGDFIKLLTVLTGKSPDGQLGQVNGALGQTIGNLLDGKKSAIGIIGTVITAVLQLIGPHLNAAVPLFGSFDTLGKAALPVFLGTTAWGILGKFEKWLAPR
ncbi:hypothetical protein [Bradyrhizobium sp. BR 10289]|uniref:hypothetical protein n=1 Tax=Bradyrhizobium sp. BR 10289 TaxID=2749993 RepID=UPI001C644E8A|nr:hypothetical protein [Bradyrhizobium sp. BR 10289]MBW7971038.1 hypothetical protein [Bradyrhizobium sp. BR 10289]